MRLAILLWTLLIGYLAFSGVDAAFEGWTAKPEAGQAGTLVGVWISLFMWFVVWLIVATPLYMLRRK